MGEVIMTRKALIVKLGAIGDVAVCVAGGAEALSIRLGNRLAVRKDCCAVALML